MMDGEQFWHELCTNPARRSALVKALSMRKLGGKTDNPCERSGYHRQRPTVTVREQEPIALPGPKEAPE